MKRRAITTAWIILSLMSGIITWVILYLLYIYLFPGYVATANSITSLFGGQYPALNSFVGNLTSNVNGAFILIGVGVFFFMLVAPYLFEPVSSGGDAFG